MEVPELKLAFLGGLSVQLDGQPLPGLSSQKALALLCYLAVTNQTKSRLALAGLLWGDMPESNALMNLRQALTQLRQQVGDHLSITRQQVAFNPDSPHWIDTAALAKAERLLSTPEAISSQQLSGLEEAIALYKGDFLDDFYVHDAPEFEQWVAGKRAYYRELVLQVMQFVATEYEKRARYQSAIEYTRRILRLEPWLESAHRNLMRLLAYAGQRGAALAQYETSRRILQEELGVDPSVETQALYQSIRNEALKPSPARPTVLSPIQPHRPAFLDEYAPAAALAAERPFVGRQVQLSNLMGYLIDARAGAGKVAFVSAEAGWGKTSLLANFSRRAQEKYPDLIVANGVCTTYTGVGDPYLPFREILRMLTGDIEGKWAAGTITREHAMRLWDLLPSVLTALEVRGGNLVDTILSGEALLNRASAHASINTDMIQGLQALIKHSQKEGVNQENIFEAYSDVLLEISSQHPLLLILDDLHWADASSINLLFHLGKRLVDSPTLIVGAYRPEEVDLGRGGKEHPLMSLLNEFKRLFGDTWLYLDQGGREQSRQFVDALLDTEPNRLGDAFRELLAGYTRGHPLFAVEMIHEMQQRGDLRQDQAGYWVESPSITWDSLPGRVEGVIEKHIARLEPSLRELLIAASVEGEEFTAEAIAQVQGIDKERMVKLLSVDLAKGRRLVRARGVEQLGDERLSCYQFSHNLFQKYLYSTLDPVERVYQHEAIGNALEHLYHGRTEEIAGRLARHFQEAGVTGKAIQYYRQAGETASRVYATAEAIAHFSQAIHLAEKIDLCDEDLTSLYIRLGRALELESSFDRALANYKELERLGLQRNNLAMQLTSLMARVTILSVPTTLHDSQQACTLGEHALKLACELDDHAAEAKILWSLSIANLFSNRLPEAIGAGERSLELARHNHLRQQTAQTLNDLGGFIYLYSGMIEQSKAALQEASQLWRDLDDKPMLADSLSGACIAHVYAGDFDRAIALSDEANQLSRSIDNIWGQAYSFWAVGDAYAERGEFSQAINLMNACIDLGINAGFLASQTYPRVRLAQVLMELGFLDDAQGLVEQALAVSKAHIPPHVVAGLGVLARLQVLQGDLDGAEASIQAGLSDPYRDTWRVFTLPVLFAQVELALSQGHPSEAVSAAGDLIKRLRSYGMRSLLPEALLLQGGALMRLGKGELADQCLEEARATAVAIGSRRTLWRILFAMSQLEADPAMSAVLLQQAQAIVAYILEHFEAEHADLRQQFINKCEVQLLIQPVESSIG